MHRPQSANLYAKAQAVLPGGVNSPVRAFGQVGGTPVFFKSAKGAYLYCEDGQRYIDYIGSWGPMIAGHGHPHIEEAILRAVRDGTSFGAPNRREAELAERVRAAVPSMQMMRMVSSGTEACLAAIRVARGFTGRSKIIKFAGCYHGHADSFLVKAGSGVLTLGLPNSPGVPSALADLTLTLDYNDSAQVEQVMRDVGADVAAIIVEPVAGNMNLIPPAPAFLQTLRKVCDEHGALLIFDEVMTGFRVALGGAQGRYGITPDLSTFGKVIGAGMPVGCYGGRTDIMSKVAPLGPIYQAGTLSGNPVAMAAGLANLDLIEAPNFFADLEASSERLCAGLRSAAAANNVVLSTHVVGGMFGFFFSAQAAMCFDEAKAGDIEHFKRFFHAMLDRGVYLAPSAFEAGFISSAHDASVLEETITAANEAFAVSRAA
jgi:glutamate-1-semialdehyde 2,1-aminomutase